MYEYDDFIKECADLCKRHGVVLVGTCVHEGVYGEIQILDREGSYPEFYDHPINCRTSMIDNQVERIGLFSYEAEESE